MVWLTEARVPEGLRLYAIGDVHGCLRMLEGVHGWIEADLAARPAQDWRIIHVGDYVDRGPDNRGTIDYLIGRDTDPRVICLRGNHDQLFLDALAGDLRTMEIWLANGGLETLRDYDIVMEDIHRSADPGALIRGAVPEAHRSFLDGLPMDARFGDYVFVHAGIMPGIPLAAQDPDDLMWIRGAFLQSEREHEAVVIHGHTPVRNVDIRGNRIGIDTGAVFGRVLTCLVLEGQDRAILAPDGPVPLGT